MFVSLMSCKDDGVHPVAIEDGMYVIDRHGLVENYAPDFSKNKIYVYMITGCMNEWLSRTPRGKIERIMDDNPDWELLVYVDGSVKDTSKVRAKLEQYDCNIPVIVDTKGVFRKLNGMKEVILWGGIYDKNDVMIGVGVIGDGQVCLTPNLKKQSEEYMRGTGNRFWLIITIYCLQSGNYITNIMITSKYSESASEHYFKHIQELLISGNKCDM